MGTTHSEASVGLTDEQRVSIEGLRALADFCEANPDVPMVHGVIAVANVNESSTGEDPKARFARIARSGGRWEKGADGGSFDLTRMFGPHKLIVFASREAVCEKVVTTETVTRKVPDPARLAEVPTVTVTETAEKVEWVCPPSLLAVAEEGDAA